MTSPNLKRCICSGVHSPKRGFHGIIRDIAAGYTTLKNLGAMVVVFLNERGKETDLVSTICSSAR